MPYTDHDAWAVKRRHRPQRVITGRQVWYLIALLGILSAAAAFGLLLEFIAEIWFGHALGMVDRQVFHGLQNLRSPLLDQWFVIITRLGNAPALLAVGVACAALLLLARRGFVALAMAGCFAGAGMTVLSLKWLLYRHRPVPAVPLISENNPAFPSAHASLSLVIYVFAAYLVARWLRSGHLRVLALGAGLGLAFLIGLSRLYLGVHWLSDVLGGYALGGMWLALLVTLVELRRIERPPSECSHRHQAAMRWGLMLLLPLLILFLGLYALGWQAGWLQG